MVCQNGFIILVLTLKRSVTVKLFNCKISSTNIIVRTKKLIGRNTKLYVSSEKVSIEHGSSCC